MVNEQTGITHTPPPGTTPQALTFTWDDAGNLLQRGIAGTTTFTWKYKHDRWGRLTQVDQMNDTTAEPAWSSPAPVDTLIMLASSPCSLERFGAEVSK